MATMTSYVRIVVGTDGSPLAEPTVARAAMLAANEGADLLIVCAYSALSQHDEAVNTGQLADVLGKAVLGRRAASDALAAASATADGMGAKVAETILVEAEPAPALLKVADDKQADLIVLGAVRDTSIANRLLGDVSSEIVRKAGCEVLIVRPPAAWGDVKEFDRPADE